MDEVSPHVDPIPLSAEAATERIREIARGDPDLYLTKHAKERMLEREIYTPDVLHVVTFGTVPRTGEPSSRTGVFKYRMESKTPNSEGRVLALIVIPAGGNVLKVVTVHWANEIN
jgi:hypothetical protein